MKNVRIGVKLAGGFLCMTLLTLILAAISYLGNEQLQSSLSEISEVRLPSVLGLEVMNEAPGYQNMAQDGHYVPRPTERPTTKFERRGEKLGHGVWDLKFQRIS